MNDGGRIINFSSTTLALNMPGYAIYNATKAAVESFTHVFAKELRGRNITVNAVAPGPIATALFLDGKTDEQIQDFRQDAAAAAPRPTGRYCVGGGVPREPGSRVGQRASAAGERRIGLRRVRRRSSGLKRLKTAA